MRRQEFQSIKTHEFVYQDTSGIFPALSSLMAVATDKGIARFTRDVSLNSIYADTATFEKLYVTGNQDATFRNLIATNARFDDMTVSGSATFLDNMYYNGEVLAGNVDATENYMVAVGPDTSGGRSIRTSANGSYWMNASGNLFGFAGNGVAWNGALWVAVGQNSQNSYDPSSNTIAYSSNGLYWKFASGGFRSFGKGVAWNGSYWLAVGTDATEGVNTILRSKDGVNWEQATTQILFETDNADKIGYGSGVAWNGYYWVVVGYDEKNSSKSTYTSKDSIVWTLAGTTDTLLNPGARSIAWGNTWVTVGQNEARDRNTYNIQTGIESTTLDTIVFTTVSTPLNCNSANSVAWNGCNWVIAADEGLFSDAYGDWNLVPDQKTQSKKWTGITWNGTVWIAVGNDGIWTSPDGLTWKSAKGIGSIAAYGIAARKILPTKGYTLPNTIPASRNVVDASGMDTVFVSDTNVLRQSVILLTVRNPNSKGKHPKDSPGTYNQGRAYIYNKTPGSGFTITSYPYDYSTYDYVIIN